MKKLLNYPISIGVVLFWVLLLLSSTINAQNNKGESNNLSLISSPGTYIDFGHHEYSDDGFNIGIQYEYQNKLVYVSPEIFFFPDLNGMDYLHFIGRFGLNKEFGFKNKLRLYIGGRAGILYREGGGFRYAILGGELGMQYTFKTGLFFKIAPVLDYRTDSKLWGNQDAHTVNSVIFGLGIRF